ncbi:MAG: alpha/beta hydrolase [SAR324 cluster bacterium]|nr:alpha/beta hydrolase [SAR324 cluster bacterium]MBL7035285.1 alpha/beta hydrolase [SAR324 cluster bacterium]
MLYHNFSTQEEIDQEYNPRFIVENTDELIQNYFTESARVLKEYSHQSGVQYGPTKAEILDIYFAEKANSPIHIFFHGGYWHSLSSRDFAFVAEGLVSNGITAVLVNYALCPQVSLDEIVRQARAAVVWTFRNAASFGGNPECITVSGHSAGGHLTGMLMSTEWEKDYDLTANIIKGYLPISGLFELTPFPFSWLQPKLQLTATEVLRNSPVLRKPTCSAPVFIAVGATESQEFIRQSKQYALFLQKNEVAAELAIIQQKNHFDIIQDFLGDGGLFCKKIMEWK